MKTRIDLFHYKIVLKKDSDFKSPLTGCNDYSLDSFLAFFAAFFLLGLRQVFFVFSIASLFFANCPAPNLVRMKLHAGILLVINLLIELMNHCQHKLLPHKEQIITGKFC